MKAPGTAASEGSEEEGENSRSTHQGSHSMMSKIGRLPWTNGGEPSTFSPT